MLKRTTAPAKAAATTVRAKRKAVPPAVKFVVLAESGYKCGSPTCRHVLTLELHHITWVRDGGGNDASNLLALCAYCHGLHTAGHIPETAIRVWKSALVALNSANRGIADILLHLARMASHTAGEGALYSPGDLIQVAPLINAGLLQARPVSISGPAFMMSAFATFALELTPRGVDFVEAWKAGSGADFQQALERNVRAQVPAV